jgi:hypothetical protein
MTSEYDEGFNAGQDSLLDEVAALRAEVERLRKALQTVCDDCEVIVCDCGEPYAGTDPHEVARAALRGEEK